MNKNVILVLGLGAGIAAAYMNRSSVSENLLPTATTPQLPENPQSYPPNTFPLKLGSRGNLVKDVQNALIRKGGAAASELTATGGADGIFGKGTERALQKAGFSKVVNKSDYELIIGIATRSVSPSQFDAGAVSRMVRRYNDNLFSNSDDAVRVLRLIGNPKQYMAVSDRVKQWSGGKSLLEVAFNRVTFGKDAIRNEFSRMGLVQNSDGSWTVPSLNGLGGAVRNVLATTPTEYTDIEGTKYYTSGRNVLGVFLRSHKGVTYFMQEGKVFGIPSTHIVKV